MMNPFGGMFGIGDFEQNQIAPKMMPTMGSAIGSMFGGGPKPIVGVGNDNMGGLPAGARLIGGAKPVMGGPVAPRIPAPNIGPGPMNPGAGMPGPVLNKMGNVLGSGRAKRAARIARRGY